MVGTIPLKHVGLRLGRMSGLRSRADRADLERRARSRRRRASRRADPIQRIVFAAAMTERLVLHPPSDLVEATVPDTHHMKRVCDSGRVIEMWGQSRPEALGEIGGDDLDACEPGRIRLGGPSAQVSGPVARAPCRSRSVPRDPPDRSRTRSSGAGSRRGTTSHRPRAGTTGPTRSGSSTSGVPCSITAFMTVHQHTPNSLATWDTGRAFSPTWRQASTPARRVITACASTSVRAFRPGLRVARVVDTTPTSLAPHQPGRPAEARQVTELHHLAFMSFGARSTRSTPHQLGDRLDGDHKLVGRSRPPRAPGTPPVPATLPPARYRRSRRGPPRRRSREEAATMTGPLPQQVDPQLPTFPTPTRRAPDQVRRARPAGATEAGTASPIRSGPKCQSS